VNSNLCLNSFVWVVLKIWKGSLPPPTLFLFFLAQHCSSSSAPLAARRRRCAFAAQSGEVCWWPLNFLPSPAQAAQPTLFLSACSPAQLNFPAQRGPHPPSPRAPPPVADGRGPPVIRFLAPPPRLATKPGSSSGWTPTRRPCRPSPPPRGPACQGDPPLPI
jgi:hypothetical protein